MYNKLSIAIVAFAITAFIPASVFAENNRSRIAQLETDLAALTERLNNLQLTPGPQGVAGTKGDPGMNGSAGIQGPTGPQGPSGNAGSSPVFKFAGYSAILVSANSSLVTKNEACRDAFTDSTLPSKMASTNDLVNAMDNGSFTEPTSTALVRTVYAGVISHSGGLLVDTLGNQKVGICIGGSRQNRHSTYYAISSRFSSVLCDPTTYIVACSIAQ